MLLTRCLTGSLSLSDSRFHTQRLTLQRASAAYLSWGVMADRVILTPGVVPVDLVMVAMMLLRKGGTCVLTGMAKITDMMVPLLLPDMVSSCKTLKGVLYGEMNPRDAMPMLLSMCEAGTLKLDELVTQKYKLDDINEAMKDLRAGKNIRGVIAFE